MTDFRAVLDAYRDACRANKVPDCKCLVCDKRGAEEFAARAKVEALHAAAHGELGDTIERLSLRDRQALAIGLRELERDESALDSIGE